MMGYINTFNARREEKVSKLYSTILLLQESTIVLTLSKRIEPIRRLAEHVGKCCKTWADQDRIKAIDNEHERGKNLCTVAHYIEALKTEFLKSYLDISSVLIRSNSLCLRLSGKSPTIIDLGLCVSIQQRSGHCAKMLDQVPHQAMRSTQNMK